MTFWEEREREEEAEEKDQEENTKEKTEPQPRGEDKIVDHAPRPHPLEIWRSVVQ